MEIFCETFGGVCKYIIHAVADEDTSIDDFGGNAAYIVSDLPRGAGYKTLVHYGQSIKAGGFRRYDFGRRGNKAKYG